MGALQAIRANVQAILDLPPDDLWAVDYIIVLSFVNTWHMDPEPVWGYLVGAPGSGKTEILRILEGWRQAIFVDELTENGLASGAKDEETGEDISLLPRLHMRVLIVKDFSSVSGSNQQTVTKVISTLRSAYDGSFQKQSGKHGMKEYRCKFGIIMATVPTIDHFLADTQSLGERFVLLRMQRLGTGDRHQRTARLRHARSMMANKTIWRAKLRITTQALLENIRQYAEQINPADVVITDAQGDVLDNAADLVCRLRTMPLRGMAVAAEVGNRLVQQLTNVAKARAICEGRQSISEMDLVLSRRVASDTLPRMAYTAFYYLYRNGCPKHLTVEQIANYGKLDLTALTELLHQWDSLNVINLEQGHYYLTPDTVEQANIAQLYPLDRGDEDV